MIMIDARFRIAILIALLISLSISGAYARVVWLSDQELTDISDVVVEGQVVRVTSRNIATREGLFFTKAKIAKFEVTKTFKGRVGRSIMIEFVPPSGGEPDLEDAQFEIGQKGFAYLKKMPNGSYRPVAGWMQGFKPVK